MALKNSFAYEEIYLIQEIGGVEESFWFWILSQILLIYFSKTSLSFYLFLFVFLSLKKKKKENKLLPIYLWYRLQAILKTHPNKNNSTETHVLNVMKCGSDIKLLF